MSTKPAKVQVAAVTRRVAGAGAIKVMRLGLFLLRLVASLLVSLQCPAVRADSVTGTWTGTLHGALHYYYEGSTRVVMPEAGLILEAPNGLRLGFSHLVDVITSASVAATGRNQDQLQNEYRHGPQLVLGKTFDVGGTKLAVDAVGRYSTENDYRSLSAGLDMSLALNSGNTVLRLGGARLEDRIEANNDPAFAEQLQAWSGMVGVEQILNPTMVLTVGYQIGHQTGFLGNAYRSITREGANEREQPPELRVRHGLSSRWAWYVPPATLAVHVLGRAYVDSWDVKGFSPELRLYKELGALFMVRLRYRFYLQTGAEFYRKDGAYPRGWSGPTTQDPKLAPFSSHTVGIRFDLDTPFLSRTLLDFAANSTIYLSLDRVFTGIPRYGPQIVGAAGGLLRF